METFIRQLSGKEKVYLDAEVNHRGSRRKWVHFDVDVIHMRT